MDLDQLYVKATGKTGFTPPNPTDITGNTHAAAITQLLNAGIVDMCTRTTYCPDTPVYEDTNIANDTDTAATGSCGQKRRGSARQPFVTSNLARRSTNGAHHSS